MLADQVGLGKTVQLALAAKLMALWGDGNVLVLVPKPLLQQWQDELWNLLRLPVGDLDRRGWEDEREVSPPGGRRRRPAEMPPPRRPRLDRSGHPAERRVRRSSQR